MLESHPKGEIKQSLKVDGRGNWVGEDIRRENGGSGERGRRDGQMAMKMHGNVQLT